MQPCSNEVATRQRNLLELLSLSQESPSFANLHDEKAPGAFRTIGEVSEELGVPQHVLRFWEERFPQIKPLYRGGRRYYRPQDVDTLTKIQHLLKQEGYTIKGAKKAFSDSPVNTPISLRPAPPEKPISQLTDTQASQLSVLRQELLTMRDMLKAHVK
jgi:DNA-binding transcriptional MerR regulator